MAKTEDWHQKQLIQWVKTIPAGQYLFHIPNETPGGNGAAVWRMRNEAMGVRGGVPDLFLPIPAGPYHGLFIEMKAGNGKVNYKQEKWIQALRDFGYKVEVCYGWEAARDAITSYLFPFHGGAMGSDETGMDG